jgi:hypothetical protein
MMDRQLVICISLILVAVVLSRAPQCGCGCRTVAQHLLRTGLGGLGGLLV